MSVSEKFDEAIDSPRGQAHFLGAGAAVTLLLLAALIPKSIPVVILERADRFEVHPTFVQFHVEGYKIRDCQPVLGFVREEMRGGNPVPLYRAEVRGASGRWRETVVEFLDDETPGSSHIPDWFAPTSFDVWRVHYPRGFRRPPIAARVPMSHLCGEDGDIAVRTLMGPFRVKGAKVVGPES